MNYIYVGGGDENINSNIDLIILFNEMNAEDVETLWFKIFI